MQVTNYELGVVLPLKDDDHVNKIACWERPPKKYVLGDDVPWVRSDVTLSSNCCLSEYSLYLKMQDDSKILQQLRAEP
jgi:tyrosyl-DNA phosphodiesterase 1